MYSRLKTILLIFIGLASICAQETVKTQKSQVNNHSIQNIEPIYQQLNKKKIPFKQALYFIPDISPSSYSVVDTQIYPENQQRFKLNVKQDNFVKQSQESQKNVQIKQTKDILKSQVIKDKSVSNNLKKQEDKTIQNDETIKKIVISDKQKSKVQLKQPQNLQKSKKQEKKQQKKQKKQQKKQDKKQEKKQQKEQQKQNKEKQQKEQEKKQLKNQESKQEKKQQRRQKKEQQRKQEKKQEKKIEIKQQKKQNPHNPHGSSNPHGSKNPHAHGGGGFITKQPRVFKQKPVKLAKPLPIRPTPKQVSFRGQQQNQPGMMITYEFQKPVVPDVNQKIQEQKVDTKKTGQKQNEKYIVNNKVVPVDQFVDKIVPYSSQEDKLKLKQKPDAPTLSTKQIMKMYTQEIDMRYQAALKSYTITKQNMFKVLNRKNKIQKSTVPLSFKKNVSEMLGALVILVIIFFGFKSKQQIKQRGKYSPLQTEVEEISLTRLKQ